VVIDHSTNLETGIHKKHGPFDFAGVGFIQDLENVANTPRAFVRGDLNSADLVLAVIVYG